MNKKISIITINYNNLEGLKKTVESVLNQTWRGFEYIIIDGGSKDGSAAYIKSQREYLDYWVSEPDKGIYNAMNKGIKAGKGEYLLFLNSGDCLYDSTVIEKSAKHLSGCDLITFDMEMVGENRSTIETYPSELKFSDMFYGYLPHSSTFIKKQLFDKVGLYDETLKIVSDWKFMILALFTYQCSYCKIEGTVSTFYLGGISSQVNNSKERDEVLKSSFSNFYEDYKVLEEQQKLLAMNRFKMLLELEKTYLGRKAVSLLFRICVVLFSTRKLKDIINTK
jgi:glycosyltransferase involved in cell wall biosynthesis